MARIEDSAGEDNSFKHCYKGKKKEKCHIGKDAVSRERFFVLFWALFYGFFFKYMEPISVYSFELSLISLLYASCSRDP